MTYSPVQAP